MFVIEQLLSTRGANPNLWRVLVLNGQLIYRSASDAAEIVRNCIPDLEDDVECAYRFRAVDRHEAMELAPIFERSAGKRPKGSRV